MKNLALLLVISTASNVAYADKFTDSVSRATMVPDSDALAALFWSTDPKCEKLENILHKNQCIEVSSKRREEISGQTYFVEGTSPVSVNKNGKKSIKINVFAAFSKGHDETWIVGSGKVDKKSDVPQTLHSQVGKRFKDTQYLEHWRTYVAPRLKSEFLVKIPSKVKTFNAKRKTGVQLEVLGYRLFDPCTGKVLASKPVTKVAPQDASTCESEPKFVKTIAPPPKSVGPQLPGQLSRKDIGDSLKVLKDRAVVCHSAYGINGRASFRFTIGKNGVIKESKQQGDFIETPTGICLNQSLKALRFPAFKDKDMKVSYPVVLR